MRPSPLLDGSRHHAALAAALLVLAIVLGGGGTPNPSTELLLQLISGFALLGWFWLPGPIRRPSDPLLWLLAATVLIVPAFQLVPLPPQVWQALPGREAQVAALALVGDKDSWQPFSMSPPRTLASFLAMIPPVALMLMTGSLGRRERNWLLAAAAAMATASAILGAGQLAEGGNLTFYAESHRGVVIGFQANRNATADVLLIGLLALAAFAASGRPTAGKPPAAKETRNNWWFIGAAVLIILACALTGSRTGVALIVPVLIASWLILALDPRKSRNRTLPALAAGAVTLIGSGLFLARHSTALSRVAERFDFSGDGREAIWPDTIYAIGQFWPFGSGISTFVPTFIALEPLEAIDSSMPNRAHNDYLELVLEAGAFGIAALVLAVCLIAFMARRSWRRDAGGRVQIAFGLAALTVIAAHSVVDYPLRSMSLACLAAVAAGMLAQRQALPIRS